MKLGDIATINGIEIDLFKRKFFHSLFLEQSEVRNGCGQQMSYRAITSGILTMTV